MVLKPIDRWAGEGPGFDRPLAEAVYHTIAKMAPDEAVMFSRLIADAVLQDDLLVHGQLIAKTVLAERAERATAIKKRLARTAIAKARNGQDADAELVALDELTKSFLGDLFSPQKRSERARKQRRSASSGQFVRETHELIREHDKPYSATNEHRLGIPPMSAEEAATLTPQERAAYQQAYHQVSELIKPYRRLPAGSALMHLTDNAGDTEMHAIPHGDTKLDTKPFNPANGRTIDRLQISVIPPADEKGAYFSLFDALGLPQAGAVAAGATKGGALDKDRVQSFGEKWHAARPDDQFTPSNKVFRRVHASSKLISDTLGDVAPPPAKIALATARHVAELGPQVHTVVAPTLDRAAYRYRGTERKPDPKLNLAIEDDARTAGRKATAATESFKTLRESAERRDGLLNRNYRNAAAQAEQVSQEWERATRAHKSGLIDRGQLKDTNRAAQRELSRITTARNAADKAAHAEHEVAVADHQRQMALGAQQHRARTSQIIARGYTANGRWQPGQTLAYMKRQVPSPELNELHLQAGTIPPSEGVILNDKNQVVSQAVGYGEDHYLPFPLRTLRKLRGGSYIRTRTWGGPTPEDIRTSLLGGARELTVVSNNGVFNIEFDPTFTGGRRHNDKAHRMIGRYEHLLDAVRSESVSRGQVDPAVLDALHEKARRKFPTDQIAQGNEFRRLEADERKNPTLTPEQSDAAAGEYMRVLANEHGKNGENSPEQLVDDIAGRRADVKLAEARKWRAEAERNNAPSLEGLSQEERDKLTDPNLKRANPLAAKLPPLPSLEVVRQEEKDKLTDPNPTEQARKLAHVFGADAGFTAYMENAKRENKANLQRMRLDGPGYAAAMDALREQFPYYIRRTKFERWDNQSQRVDTGFVRVGASRPGAAQAGFSGSKVNADTIRGQAAVGSAVRRATAAVTESTAPAPVAATEETDAKMRERVDVEMLRTLLRQTQFGPNGTLGPQKDAIGGMPIAAELNMHPQFAPPALQPFYLGVVSETALIDQLEKNPAVMRPKIAAAVRWFKDNTAAPVGDDAWDAAVRDFESGGRASSAVEETDPSRMLRQPDREYAFAQALGPEYRPGEADSEEIIAAYLKDPEIGALVKARELPATIGTSKEQTAEFTAAADALTKKLTVHDDARARYRAGAQVGDMPYEDHAEQVKGLIQAMTLQRRIEQAGRAEADAAQAKQEARQEDFARNQPIRQEQVDYGMWGPEDFARLADDPDLAARVVAGRKAIGLDPADPGLSAADLLEQQRADGAAERAAEYARRQGGGS